MSQCTTNIDDFPIEHEKEMSTDKRRYQLTAYQLSQNSFGQKFIVVISETKVSSNILMNHSAFIAKTCHCKLQRSLRGLTKPEGNSDISDTTSRTRNLS